MCWVALDRLLEMDRAGDLRLGRARRERFSRTRGEIREAVEERGWCARIDSYAGVLDGDQVDASLLLLPIYGYIDPQDPRMRATFERVREELGQDGLLRRYPPGTDDGLSGGEGAFGICSFWTVEYLARSGRVDEAEEEFEALCGKSNDVGLYAEELDPRGGQALGNFPQAFSHVGLVNAALAIAEARGERPRSEIGGRQRLEQTGRVPGKQEAEALRTEATG
jgi:GH15 family glucan-1,4-alpha-glucosidase